MNSQFRSEVDLIHELQARLGSILGSIAWLKSWKTVREPFEIDRGFDLAIQLTSESGLNAELWVECKSNIRPANFPFAELKHVLMRSGTSKTRIPVLAAPTISPRMADLCRKNGWSWFDLAGNCLLNIPGGIWIERTGLSSERKTPKPEANLATAESARILRSLLSEPNLERNWIQRELQEACSPEVSLGLVNKVTRHLRNQKYLVEAEGSSGLRLADPLGLLMEWKDKYRFSKHTRFDLFTLCKRGKAFDQIRAIETEAPRQCALASFSAAEQISPQIRGESKIWVYASRQVEPLIRDRLETQKVDTGANLTLLVPEDNGVFFDLEPSNMDHPPTTSPIQTYLDLVNSGGRGEEAAEALLEYKLKPLWRKAGFEC